MVHPTYHPLRPTPHQIATKGGGLSAFAGKLAAAARTVLNDVAAGSAPAGARVEPISPQPQLTPAPAPAAAAGGAGVGATPFRSEEPVAVMRPSPSLPASTDELSTLSTRISDIEKYTSLLTVYIANIRSLKEELQKAPTARVTGIIARCITEACKDASLKETLVRVISESTGTALTIATVEEHLVRNPSLFTELMDGLGITLIDQIIEKYSREMSEATGVVGLLYLKKELMKIPFNLTKVRPCFERLPDHLKQFFYYRAWELNGKSGDGAKLIHDNLANLSNMNGACLINELISQTVSKAQATDFTLTILPKETYESSSAFFDKILANKIMALRAAMLSGRPKEEVVPLFHTLPDDLKNYLSELIWRLDGEIPGDTHYGIHQIENNPYRLLHIKDEKGADILEQLQKNFHTLRALKIHTATIENLAGYLRETPPNITAFKAGFAALDAKASLHEIAERLRFKVWERDSERVAEGDLTYGTRTIEEDPLTLLAPSADGSSIMDAVLTELNGGIASLETRALIEKLRDPRRYTTDVAKLAGKVAVSAETRIAMITAEFGGILKQGGLGEAVRGMADGLGGRNVTVIMPRYDDAVLPPKVVADLAAAKESGPAYEVDMYYAGAMRKFPVYRIKQGDITCLMIEHNELFTIGKTGEEANNIYGKDHDYAHAQARFAYFQKLAAELAKKMYEEKEIDVVHVHDAQTGLVPRILAHSYGRDWMEGKTPPIVFTFHNNLSQQRYEDEATIASIRGIGLENRGYNGFIEGVESADVVTTVSRRFGEEARSLGDEKTLGKGVGMYVKRAAIDGRFYDVLNGNSSTFDPKRNKILREWRDVDTGEALDLSYGPDDSAETIALKKRQCKEQVAKYMRKYGHGTINPDLPLLLNVGRFDAGQKGIDKLPFIMDTAKRSGAQMVCIGLDSKDDTGRTKPEVENIRRVSDSFGREGAILIEDVREHGQIKWQAGHTRTVTGADGSTREEAVPGIGPVLRAAADICVFPSEFEPCGLVQGESWLFGSRVLATNTGGFHDTVVTEGERKNGWLFDRKEDWRHYDQSVAIAESLQRAIAEIQHELYGTGTDAEARKLAFYEQSIRIMREAIKASWTDTPVAGTLTPVEKLRHAYALAQERAKARGHSHFSIHKAEPL